jgi:hypothetical protein
VNATQVQGRELSAAAPASGQVLTWNATAARWEPQTVTAGVLTVFGRSGTVIPQSGDYQFSQIGGTVANAQLPAAGGDLSGSLAAATVAGIQGNPVAGTAPADGQMMRWNAGAGQWQPVRVRYTKTFTGLTTVVIPGSEHQLATADLTVTCFDAATNQKYGFDTLTIDPVTFDVTITHAVPQDGRCVLR